MRPEPIPLVDFIKDHHYDFLRYELWLTDTLKEMVRGHFKVRKDDIVAVVGIDESNPIVGLDESNMIVLRFNGRLSVPAVKEDLTDLLKEWAKEEEFKITVAQAPLYKFTCMIQSLSADVEKIEPEKTEEETPEEDGEDTGEEDIPEGPSGPAEPPESPEPAGEEPEPPEEKPAKPEKPEKPAKPEKPEKPTEKPEGK